LSERGFPGVERRSGSRGIGTKVKNYLILLMNVDVNTDELDNLWGIGYEKTRCPFGLIGIQTVSGFCVLSANGR
jgi:hypothetical protein